LNDLRAQVVISNLIVMAGELPPLPRLARYYDDFEDTYRSINELSSSDKWIIRYDGRSETIDFTIAPDETRLIIKHVAAELLSRLEPSNCSFICNVLLRDNSHFINAILLSPAEFRSYWATEVKPMVSTGYANRLRTAIHSLCNLSIGHWTPDLNFYVSQLESTPQDIYKTVRTGECFVPMAHQSLLIDYFDEMVACVENDASNISTNDIRDACILIISHQYGLRPGQISRVKISDVREFDSGSVHIAFPLLKQRGDEKMRTIVRRIKNDWCLLFSEYVKRRQVIPSKEGVHNESFFKLTPQELSKVIQGLTKEITGTKWTPMDLRHSAAQRLADAGIAHISLSEFMGHSTTLTANVYFDASPAQAQRVNQALALSPIYLQVAEMARVRTIDKPALLRMRPDQQIGGVPHGIPISGIGECQSGQSLCVKNPILSCYTCRKFLPLSDPEIHEEVIKSLRPVVMEFAKSALSQNENPAYVQLRRTLESAITVASDIRAGNTEPS